VAKGKSLADAVARGTKSDAVAVKPQARREGKRAITVYVDAAIHTKLRHLAIDMNSSVDAFVSDAIAEAIARRASGGGR
jgi:predicted HicB family RNase H-like nuclease